MYNIVVWTNSEPVPKYFTEDCAPTPMFNSYSSDTSWDLQQSSFKTLSRNLLQRSTAVQIPQTLFHWRRRWSSKHFQRIKHLCVTHSIVCKSLSRKIIGAWLAAPLARLQRHYVRAVTQSCLPPSHCPFELVVISNTSVYMHCTTEKAGTNSPSIYDLLPWPKKKKKNDHLDYAQNQNTVLITQYHVMSSEHDLDTGGAASRIATPLWKHAWFFDVPW